MSAISDFCNVVRGWLNLGPEVYPDPVVTSWVRMSEEYLSENLRVKHMIQIDSSPLIESRVLLPSDWQELDTVRFPGGKPLFYKPRHEFYGNSSLGGYTVVGNYILVGGVDPVAGTPVELSYYQNIPPLEEDNNWLNKYYSRVYILSTLWHASLYAVEDDRGASWGDATQQFVSDMNSKHQTSKSSGSVLVSNVRRRSFG